MKTSFAVASIFVGGCLALSSFAQEPPKDTESAHDDNTAEPPGAVYEGRAFQFHKIKEDIYHAVGTGELDVICNSTIIINERDVMVVDSHVTPAAAWVLKRELKFITPKPIINGLVRSAAKFS